MSENTENLTPMQKLHYQMLRKHYDGTLDDAINLLKTKIASEDRKDGEPMVIYYQDEDGQEVGAIFAVPSSDGTGEGYMFYNADQIDKRFEEDELVTAEALLDLDERISGITSQFSAFTENASDKIVITKDIKAIGVDAGAIKNGNTVLSGTTLTEFVEQLLTQNLDYSPVTPTVKLTTTMPDTLEVGATHTFSLTSTTTPGSFQGEENKGFDPLSKNCETSKLGTVNYVVAGTETSESSYAFTATEEGDYKVKATMAYTGSTATELGLTTNTGKPSNASFSNGTAASTESTFSVRYKYYIGSTTATTLADFDVSAITDSVTGWTSTSGTTTIKSSSQTYKSDGGSVFVLAKASTFDVKDNLSGESLKKNFTVTGNKTIEIGGGSTSEYKLWLWPITSGQKVELKSITITR